MEYGCINAVYASGLSHGKVTKKYGCSKHSGLLEACRNHVYGGAVDLGLEKFVLFHGKLKNVLSLLKKNGVRRLELLNIRGLCNCIF